MYCNAFAHFPLNSTAERLHYKPCADPDDVLFFANQQECVSLKGVHWSECELCCRSGSCIMTQCFTLNCPSSPLLLTSIASWFQRNRLIPLQTHLSSLYVSKWICSFRMIISSLPTSWHVPFTKTCMLNSKSTRGELRVKRLCQQEPPFLLRYRPNDVQASSSLLPTALKLHYESVLLKLFCNGKYRGLKVGMCQVGSNHPDKGEAPV